jgi:hypothetical protein
MASTFVRVQLSLLVVFLTIGCAAVRHGWEGADYEGKLLSASSEMGAKALNNWIGMDLDTKRYLEKNRRPDYVFNESLLAMHLFYVRENLQVSFRRPAVGVATKMTSGPIPDDMRRALMTR